MYTVTFTRPYLKDEDRFEIQRSRIQARDEKQVRSIFADCEIILIEADCEEELQELATLTPTTTEEDADAVHNYIVAAEAGDKWIAEAKAEHAAWLDFQSTRGLDVYLEARYDEQNGDMDLPI